MSQNKYLFRSSINLHWAMWLSLLLFLLFGLLLTKFENDTFIGAVMILSYFYLLSNTINVLIIYDTHVLILYFLKIHRRRNIIQFDEISIVKDINYSDGYAYPRIQILKKPTKSKLYFPNDTFPVYRFNKRKQILQFFKLKGIKIEIISDKNKEQTIIDQQ